MIVRCMYHANVDKKERDEEIRLKYHDTEERRKKDKGWKERIGMNGIGGSAMA